LLLNVPIWGQVASAIVLIVGYWALLTFVPVSDRGAGVIEEHANIALTVDQWVLGRFIDGTNPPYTWVLSSMGFAASVLLGVIAGHVLRSHLSPMLKFLWLTLLGILCLAAGWAWAQYLHLPIIKHIWTSSMLLWAAGWSYLLLALFFLVIDVWRVRFWAFPLVVVGTNAIVAYVAYDGRFIPFTDVATRLVGGLARQLDVATKYVADAAHPFGPAGTFAIALTAFLLVWLLLYHLYRQKMFLRI
jgi:predicted acyltransferase